jgi:uncharacterized protein (TIGR02757 family)
MPLRKHRRALDRLYARYTRRAHVGPDPVGVLYEYEDARDREVVALLASALAYGRAAQITRSVRACLERLGPAPGRAVRDASVEELARRFRGFRHRWHTGDDVAALLAGAGRVCVRFGSLEACFTSCLRPEDETVLPALAQFVEALGVGKRRALVASPADTSACKRLHLFLRWMVRRDAVDPGGWEAVPASKLLVPLDVHMHRLTRGLGATRRRSPDRKAALEVTRAFRRIAPRDPVKYDFALTRLGILPDGDLEGFLASCGAPAPPNR